MKNKRNSISFYCISPDLSVGLKRAIQNVYSFVDEIIIILGSDTKKAALPVYFDPQYKIKTFYKPFTYFAQMRNFALSKITGQWILTLDSDEIFSTKLLENVRILVQTKRYDGYKFHRVHFYQTPNETMDIFMHTRLFRAGKVLYVGKVHELLDGLINIKEVMDTKQVILHFNRLSDMGKNNIKYLAILERELELAKKYKNERLRAATEFRIWANLHVDNIRIYKNPRLAQAIKREFYKRRDQLMKVLGNKKNYHEELLALEKLK